jgi:hypothetical protein
MEKIRSLPAGPSLYREVQRLRQPWLILLLLGLTALVWYSAWRQLLLGRPFGNNPASNEMMVVTFLLVGIGMPLFFHRLHLATEVRMDGIYFRYWPLLLRWRHLCWESLEAAEAVTYHPLREYGGWGIRFGAKARAYIASGNRGVMLHRREGSDLLIGSQQPERFVEALRASGHLQEGRVVD